LRQNRTAAVKELAEEMTVRLKRSRANPDLQFAR